MKTFEDLEFIEHPIGNGQQARMDFESGYGISVVKFNGSYGYPELWEVGIMYKKVLTYNTHISNDVMGHQSDEDVTNIMKQVQEL